MLMHVRVQGQYGIHLILIVAMYVLKYGVARQLDLMEKEIRMKLMPVARLLSPEC